MPGAVRVGGTAASLHAGHRVSLRDDHDDERDLPVLQMLQGA